MKYTPRLTAPSTSDKNFIHYSKGGYNTCIKIDQQTGSVLPNCVGYAQGRLLEILGQNKVNWKLPAGNAEGWYDTALKNGLKVGQTPKLGAVIVWRAGVTHDSSDGAGHVAIVEEIKANGDIVVSQSAYDGDRFYLSTLTKASGYIYSSSRPLVGFIYCGIEFEDEPAVSDVTIKAGQKVVLKSTKCYSSETALNSYGCRSGNYYLWDCVPKNGRIRVTNSQSKVGIPGQVSFWVKMSDIGFEKDTANTDSSSSTPKAGDKHALVNVPVYGTEKGPCIGKRTGTYYTWDEVVRNGRIRMTNNPARVGIPGQVSFWVEVNKL